MTSKPIAWLRLFRVVNLPTVPGDILAGAAAASCFSDGLFDWRAIGGASLASVLLYMFGLADNDIVGAATDRDRPIPQGQISLVAARIARAVCIFAAIGIGLAARFANGWWFCAFFLAVAIVVYNRTKLWLLMGLCRGANCLLGAAACGAVKCTTAFNAVAPVFAGAVAFVWTLYIGGVTKYSEGEENDPARKRRVGILIGALVWLQLAAISCFSVLHDLSLSGPAFFPMVYVQLAMIALLFALKRLLPKVSAS